MTGLRNRVGAPNEKNSIKRNFAYVENAKMTGLQKSDGGNISARNASLKDKTMIWAPAEKRVSPKLYDGEICVLNQLFIVKEGISYNEWILLYLMGSCTGIEWKTWWWLETRSQIKT